MSRGINLLRGGNCDRDCRTVIDKPPYSPPTPVCTQCMRTLTACGCSCVDMYPDRTGVDAPNSGFVLAVQGSILFACGNADNGKALDGSGGTVEYDFGWTEESLATSQWLISRTAITCPAGQHTYWRAYKSTPSTNLACVSSSADWVGIELDGNPVQEDAEPEGGGTWPAPLVLQTGFTDRYDYPATVAAQPTAFLVEVRDGCDQVILLCPNLAPGGFHRTCPACEPFPCIEVTVLSDGTSSTHNEDDTSDATVKFRIDCPEKCGCVTGVATVIFTLNGASVTVDAIAVTCGETVSVMTPAPMAIGDDDRWQVSVSWTCFSSIKPCTTPNCVDLPDCPNLATAAVQIAVGGGLL